jgi:biotin carboxyl carrier protein
MPTFDVTVEGKTFHVEIPDPGASPLQVIVDGQPFEIAIAGSESAPAIASASPAPPVTSQPIPLPQLPKPPTRHAVMLAPGGQGASITAPMPGTIIAISVTAGQQVDPGQVVCVLEAMKMKNPIRSPHGGVVAEIHVQPGQSVAHGDPLVRLE